MGVTEGAGLVVGWSPRPHDCHSRVSGNPEARAGSQGPAALGVVGRSMSAFGGRRKDLGFPLTTCGNDRKGGPAGMMERGPVGMTEGTGGHGGGGPAGMAEGDRRA